jgi:hypothetical protein
MKMKLNPFAAGKALAGETMLRAYPRAFSLMTDGDIAASKQRQKEKCEVFIKPESPATLSEDKKRMVLAYQHLKEKDTMANLRASSIAIGLVFLSAAAGFATAASTVRAIAEALVLALVVKVGHSLLKRISFISEAKKLLKSAIDAIEKNPEGMRVVKISTTPATSSDTHQ